LSSLGDGSSEVASGRDLDDLGVRKTTERPQCRVLLWFDAAGGTTLQQASQIIISPAVNIS